MSILREIAKEKNDRLGDCLKGCTVLPAVVGSGQEETLVIKAKVSLLVTAADREKMAISLLKELA